MEMVKPRTTKSPDPCTSVFSQSRPSTTPSTPPSHFAGPPLRLSVVVDLVMRDPKAHHHETCRSTTMILPSNAPPQPAYLPDYAHSRLLVPAAHGRAFKVGKGKRYRIVDLHGEQVVDMMAYPVQPDGTLNSFHRLSMAYTRFHLRGATPAVGESLYTNADAPLLTLTADTVRVHDMTFMSCFPELYAKRGLPDHRSCAQNIAEALAPWGMRSYREIADPFNVFQNTPLYTLKGGLNPSRKGGWVEFRAGEECVVVVSSCPFDLEGFNGGVITDVEVVLEN